ncbi:hypothetical protein Hanom_Chr04g00318131 [Helianthus anomalus]
MQNGYHVVYSKYDLLTYHMIKITYTPYFLPHNVQHYRQSCQILKQKSQIAQAKA